MLSQDLIHLVSLLAEPKITWYCKVFMTCDDEILLEALASLRKNSHLLKYAHSWNDLTASFTGTMCTLK